jgi:hypothetical protein
MQSWLADLPEEGSLVFCHPGDAVAAQEAAECPADPIAAARVRELGYLASDDFKADLDAARVRLV